MKGEDLTDAKKALEEQLADSKRSVPQRLRALWTLHALDAWQARDGMEDTRLTGLLDDPSEHLRSWAIRLLCERSTPSSQVLERFVELAKHGDSPLVRLHLASALQRIDATAAWPLAAALLSRAEDAEDPALPLMVWYGAEPLIHGNLAAFAKLSEATKLPQARKNIARRVASLGTPEAMTAAIDAMSSLRQAEEADDFAEGMLLGLEGRRSVAMPPRWPAVFKSLS